MKRRSVVKGLAFVAGAVASGTCLTNEAFSVKAQQANATADGPYKLPALPYSYDALEPYIDATTMHLHHDKHHASYVTNLNAAIAKHPELGQKSVEQLVSDLSPVPEDIRTAVRNQGGGHANHSFFWKTLSVQGGTAPRAELARDLKARYGSFDAFQQEFSKAAASVFGSGWAWLTLSHSGTLTVEISGNQDSPLSHGVAPILGIDVWEHAYYLKHHNRRAEYIEAFFHAVNWDFVSQNYAIKR